MNQHYANLFKSFESFRYRYELANVFEDFLELAACAISNSTNKLRWEEREARYMEVVSKYTKEEANQFGDMLGMLVLALTEKPNDYLGLLFMQLELFNSWRGQFFTPYDTAYLMARMTISHELESKLKNGEIIRVNDGAVGGGVTLIAAFEIIKELGYNPQQVARFYAADIDRKAIFMTYIQLSLLGAHATVWHMNTLTLEHWDTWLSPGFFLGAGQGSKAESIALKKTELSEPTIETMAEFEQLSLF